MMAVKPMEETIYTERLHISNVPSKTPPAKKSRPKFSRKVESLLKLNCMGKGKEVGLLGVGV